MLKTEYGIDRLPRIPPDEKTFVGPFDTLKEAISWKDNYNRYYVESDENRFFVVQRTTTSWEPMPGELPRIRK